MTIVGEGAEGSAATAAMEVEAFKRLYPLQFYERYLDQSVRPDGRPLNRARPTSVNLGAIPTAEGSALVKIGHTTMLAGVKLEVVVPSTTAPDQGQLAVDFQMPTICSPLVRPGRPAEVAWSVSEQLSNALSSSNFVNLQQLCIVPGKAAWIAYVDVYCLDADGSLLDAALLAAVAALTHLQLPAVKVTEAGRVVPLTSQNVDGDQEEEISEKKSEDQIVRSRQRLERRPVPIGLTCVKHKNHLLADPSAEEESTLQTSLTVVMDSSDRLVSFYKPGGAVTATSATVKDCIDLAKKRVIEVKDLLEEAYEEAFGAEMMVE
ncbi:hypothetical protein M758_11G041500 [Ceratodon purpureus]|nr:hypothetical protein M758_11G041500 [Ceratodon purpureus]